MFELLEVESPLSLAVLSFAVIFLLIAAGAYVVSKFRDVAEDDRLDANELLTNFREMHSRGELSDQEFRNIKSNLAQQLRNELSEAENEE